MPIRYAVEEQSPTIKTGPGSKEYFPVEKDIAETHENGCYALFNDDEEQVSQWCRLNRKITPDQPSKRTSVKDAIQQTVTVGDYVGYNNSGGISPISVGKVTGFTNKQVRILPLNMYHSASSKLMYEYSIIRLPESLWHG